MIYRIKINNTIQYISIYSKHKIRKKYFKFVDNILSPPNPSSTNCPSSSSLKDKCLKSTL